MPRFQVLGERPVDLACGQMAGPGETTNRVDPKDPHDAALIEEGRLVELTSPRKTKKQEESK